METQAQTQSLQSTLATESKDYIDAEAHNFYIPEGEGEEIFLSPFINVDSTVQNIFRIARQYNSQVEVLANLIFMNESGSFKPNREVAINIWHFMRANFNYAPDRRKREQLRTPARSFADRFTGIDCDDFTIFISCLLIQYKVDHYYRVVDWEQDGYDHIYIVAIGENGEELPIDPIPEVPEPLFEIPYGRKQDYFIDANKEKISMSTTMLSGAGTETMRPDEFRAALREVFGHDIDLSREVDRRGFGNTLIKGLVQQYRDEITAAVSSGQVTAEGQKNASIELDLAALILESFDSKEDREALMRQGFEISTNKEFYQGLLELSATIGQWPDEVTTIERIIDEENTGVLNGGLSGLGIFKKIGKFFKKGIGKVVQLATGGGGGGQTPVIVQQQQPSGQNSALERQLRAERIKAETAKREAEKTKQKMEKAKEEEENKKEEQKKKIKKYALIGGGVLALIIILVIVYNSYSKSKQLKGKPKIVYRYRQSPAKSRAVSGRRKITVRRKKKTRTKRRKKRK